ncbi:hypothetical protein B0A50_01195 [Salinomyces thailandicus]|uniref:Uncharacterized protein n=1 Tax=Salinomyces thailandicus TaxID=706561 RepID=A0A4U0U9E1_9PEZI|nr:hypothetical protein B0A50_01195 [Salinomyces thailandica]
MPPHPTLPTIGASITNPLLRDRLDAWKQSVKHKAAIIMRAIPGRPSNPKHLYGGEADSCGQSGNLQLEEVKLLRSSGVSSFNGNRSRDSGYVGSVNDGSDRDEEGRRQRFDSAVSFAPQEFGYACQGRDLYAQIDEAWEDGRLGTGFGVLPSDAEEDDDSPILASNLLRPVQTDDASIISLDLDWIVRNSCIDLECATQSPDSSLFESLPEGLKACYASVPPETDVELDVGRNLPAVAEQPVEFSPRGMAALRRPSYFMEHFDLACTFGRPQLGAVPVAVGTRVR